MVSMDTIMQETNAPQLQTVMAVMMAVPFTFMALRFLAKKRYGHPFGWDDAVLLFSWLLLVGYCVVIIIATRFGIGRHIMTVKHSDMVIALKCLYFGNFFVIMAISLSKTSFAMTLLPLATKRWHVGLLWFTIITVNVIMGVDAVMQFVQCTPVEKTWDVAVQGHCWDSTIVVYYSMFAGAWAGLMDFVLALVPWMIIWAADLKRIEKIGLVVAMSLGVFSGITAFVKTAYLPNLGRWTDLTYSTPELLMWAAAETAVIIIGASIPFLRKLIRELAHKNPSTIGYQNSRVTETWVSQQADVKHYPDSKLGDIEFGSPGTDVKAAHPLDGTVSPGGLHGQREVVVSTKIGPWVVMD